MTSDTRTSDDIERDIQEERAQMSSSINDLQKKFSVESIVGDVGEMLRTQGGDMGRMVSQTVGRNPAAVALVGVGLAWLLLGQDRSQATASTDDPSGDTADRRRNRPSHDTWDRQNLASQRDAYWYGTDQMPRPGKPGGRSQTGGADTRSMGGAWDDLKSGNGVSGAIQTAASAMGDAVSRAAGSMSQGASNLSDRLSHGLEDLSEEARARVMAARHAAHDARLASGAAVAKGAQAATDFFEDQPLIVGALAVALGAAIGGVLPHSKIEDDTLGASSDQLFAKAEALLREERDKAMAMVRSAASDVQGEIKDAGSDLADLLPEGKNVGEVVVDRAADAAARVYDRAVGTVEPEDDDTPRS